MLTLFDVSSLLGRNPGHILEQGKAPFHLLYFMQAWNLVFCNYCRGVWLGLGLTLRHICRRRVLFIRGFNQANVWAAIGPKKTTSKIKRLPEINQSTERNRSPEIYQSPEIFQFQEIVSIPEIYFRDWWISVVWYISGDWFIFLGIDLYFWELIYISGDWFIFLGIDLYLWGLIYISGDWFISLGIDLYFWGLIYISGDWFNQVKAYFKQTTFFSGDLWFANISSKPCSS